MSSNTPGPTPPGPWQPTDYPAAGSPYAPDSILNSGARTNDKGRLSLILAVVGALVAMVSTIVQISLVRQGLSPSAIALWTGIVGFIGVLFAVAAVVVGIMGLRGQGPKAAAGAGTGIGAAHIFASVSSTLILWLASLV